MKSISFEETKIVCGGTILNIYGVTANIDTTGIPSQCVNELTNMTYDMFNFAKEDPNLTRSQMMIALAPHMDQMAVSGCDIYFDTFKERMLNPIAVY